MPKPLTFWRQLSMASIVMEAIAIYHNLGFIYKVNGAEMERLYEKGKVPNWRKSKQ